MRLQPYTQQYFIIHPELNLEELYYYETTAELTQYKASLFGELVFWFNGKICWGLGHIVEDILITITIAMKFQDCYKIIIESLTDWSQFTDGSGIIDECDPSNDEDITAYIFNPIVQDWTKYYQGNDLAF